MEASAPEADFLWQDHRYIRKTGKLRSQRGISDGFVCFQHVWRLRCLCSFSCLPACAKENMQTKPAGRWIFDPVFASVWTLTSSSDTVLIARKQVKYMCNVFLFSGFSIWIIWLFLGGQTDLMLCQHFSYRLHSHCNGCTGRSHDKSLQRSDGWHISAPTAVSRMQMRKQPGGHGHLSVYRHCRDVHMWNSWHADTKVELLSLLSVWGATSL